MAAVDAGWNVVGVDNSADRVAALNRGTSPVEDISDQLLASAIASKKYIATTNFADIASATVVTICVPTPLNGSAAGLFKQLHDVAQVLTQIFF